MRRPVHNFFDNFSAFIHYFSAGLCNLSWCSVQSILSWESNDILGETKMIRGWKSTRFACLYFEEILNVNEKDLFRVATLLLHTARVAMEKPGVSSNSIQSAYYSLCPVKESFSGEPFTFSEDSMKNFLTQSIFFTIRKHLKFMVSDTDHSNSANFVTKFVRVSKILFIVFGENCNEVTSSRKKVRKKLVTSCWGMASIWTMRDSAGGMIEAKKRSQL